MEIDASKMKDELILSFIERVIFWEGSLSSRYLADNFNITLKNAERYISEYMILNPENIEKEIVDANYYPNDQNFKFKFAENNYHNILKTLSEKNIPFFETLPSIQPVFDKELLRDILRSMNTGHDILTIRYQSLNSRIPEERDILPYFIYYVRGRYHIRAYCLAKKAFRDFVLSRIISVIQVSAYKGEHISDIESNEYATVIVKPHSDLSDMQRMSTEIEFGMDEGKKAMKVKKPLLIYLLDELRVGKDYYRPPFTVLELVNSDEIASVLRTS